MKQPPEMTWQDKAILIAIPVVVFIIFILANHFSKDVTIADAVKKKSPMSIVRDGGHIIQVFPSTATNTVSCRVRARDNKTEFNFNFIVTGSETMKLQVGRLIQFYGRYKYDKNGGTVTAPYKGKSGRATGWAIYENHRYLPQNVDRRSGL